MTFKLSDLPVYKFEHNFYILEISPKFDTKDEAIRFMQKTNMMLRYQLKDTGVSFIMGVSETDKNAVRRALKIGKAGRPKTVVYGDKKEPHIHAVLYGEKVCTHTLNATRRINKKAKKTIAKADKAWDSGYIPYLIEQSSNIRMFGDFDFMQLRGGFYFEDLS